jgi:hypothetical protein
MDESRAGPNDPGRRMDRQDELLELLYWLEGEGFTDRTTLDGLVRFIAQPEAEVRAAMDRLVHRGDVAATEGVPPEYRLTATGRREAARRFAESFAPLLAQGHGECNDPECDCHTDPAGAAECHARRHGDH